MPSEIEELITKLRDAESRRHAASLQAIATLERNLIGSGPTADTAIAGKQLQHKEDDVSQSNVDLVVNALESKRFKSISKISKLTGLTESRVRGVLYGRALQPRIQKTKSGKRMVFRLLPEQSNRKAPPRKKKGPSFASQVRDVLKRHPDGLRTTELRKLLPDIEANAIVGALYNMKTKSQIVLHDEATGIYRLIGNSRKSDE